MILSPSLLSADLSKLTDELLSVSPYTDWIHIDVMDGQFVPNITFGDNMVKTIRGISQTTFIDAHLMVANPEAQIDKFAKAGSSLITIHQEATPHLHKLIQTIKSYGIKAGVSLNPATSPDTLDYVLDDIDLVLIMSVNPGAGGQSFIHSQLEKIKQLRRKFKGLIEVDGGINYDTAKLCLDAGADVLVAGNFIFGVSGQERNERLDRLMGVKTG